MKPPRIEFCGEWFEVGESGEMTVGREGELAIDDNPYLHRQFLRIYEDFGMWWLANVGNLLSATVTDATGAVQAWLAPGARLPLVFPQMHVMFSAGSTTYDFTIHAADDYFNTSVTAPSGSGSTTIMPVSLTVSQKQLVLALAEDVLTQSVPGRGTLPASADAAARLGWSMTTFNRKLDNVCDKLDRIGVTGLRGGKGRLASNRRARLVEYAVATHLVSAEDLPMLDWPKDDDEHS
ncbi:hypothetical protein OSC27_07290 [Microbacterium sp. STN6]|uniref:hypothetical protein n=1 Tax=Microbacterium sp. STN6 TaxID=2995588 RepID=UPI002260D8FF|nr:hypothetical protein [Microbacterium sp. STN6]MCX7522080.1 hypothetical protein [Microbacterium sp. STN6]